MADLIETVKKIVQGVLNESSPCNVLFGTVTSANPLEITVEQKLKLTKEFLILTKNVVNYTTTATIEWNTNKINQNVNHNHSISGNINVESSISPNDNSAKITNKVTSALETEQYTKDLGHMHSIVGTKSITINNALKQNDKVILLQQAGGQKYIVLDKVYNS